MGEELAAAKLNRAVDARSFRDLLLPKDPGVPGLGDSRFR